MKIDRLIGILSILLQQEKITAPDLAARFEVSRRTINRDIEDLCKAGIPLVTEQGRGGGISIMEGYRIDRTLLTSAEMQAILAGLKGLDSVAGTRKYQQLMDKLSVNRKAMFDPGNHTLIDLSSYYKSTLAPKIEVIAQAIDEHERLTFKYFSPRGEGEREIEPYLLVFQWASWYVWGYCMERRDYRLFKLNRMLHPAGNGIKFTPRETPEYDIEPKKAFPTRFEVAALIAPQMKWRLVEEYGIDSFEIQEDGQLLFRFGFTDTDNLLSWLLSFGDQAELLEPKELREMVRTCAENIKKRYD